MNVVEFVINLAAKGDKVVTSKVDALQKKIYQTDVAADRLARTVGGKLKGALDSIPGSSFFKNPLVLLTAGTAAVAKMGMEAEKTATAFNLLAGSEEKGSKALAEMNKYAKDTIWDRKTIQDAGQAMLNYQIPVENVVDDLKRLGDVAAGDKNKLSTLATVFGQINSLGKLQTQDWKQLINVGYNPLIEIQQMTGKSMAQLQKAMSDGTISMDLVRKALIKATSEGGRYNNMVNKLASTSSGAFERMKGAVSESMYELFNIISPLLVPLFDGIASAFDNYIVPAIRVATEGITKLFDVINAGLPIIAGLTTAVASYTAVAIFNTSVLKGWNILQLAHYGILLLVEKAQWLWNAALSANPIGIVIGLVAGLATAAFICYKRFAGFRAVILTVWDTIKGFAGILKDLVISRIESLLKGIGKVGEALSKLFRGDFKGAWDSTKSAGLLLANVEGKTQAVNASRNLVAGIKGNYQENLAAARQAISEPEAAKGTNGTTGGKTSFKTSPTAVANDITTGGTRNTQITLNIGKFWDNVEVRMEDDRNLDGLSKKVLEAINRALEIGLSAAR